MSGEGRKERRGEMGGHSWQERKDYAKKGERGGKIEDRQGEREGGEGENAESSITFRRNTYIKYWDLVT